MSLLLSKITVPIILCLLLLYFPYIDYYGIDLSPDFTLIIIILIALKTGRKQATLAGFFIGLLQDLLTQYLTLGFLSLLGTFFGYSVGSIQSIKKIDMKYILIFILIFIYLFFIFVIQYSEGYFFYFKFSIIKSVITILSLFLLRNIFINFFKSIEK